MTHEPRNRLRRALILSAGQGRRLLPLTADRPKCTLTLGSRSIIEWQIDALLAAGIEEIFVVLGYAAERVERLLRQTYPDAPIRTIFNPFYEVADNLASCWMAREAMREDFVLLNGDTLFESAVLERLLDSVPRAITLAVDHKSGYDEDDMKVRLDGDRLLRVGKRLPLAEVNGESIGMMCFRGDGPRLFREALEQTMHTSIALRRWYLTVIDELAGSGVVHTQSINGLGWAEIDYPADLEAAGSLVANWDGSSAAARSTASTK